MKKINVKKLKSNLLYFGGQVIITGLVSCLVTIGTRDIRSKSEKMLKKMKEGKVKWTLKK